MESPQLQLQANKCLVARPKTGLAKGCGGATKTNGTFCGGPACTAANPCAPVACKADKTKLFKCHLCSTGKPAGTCHLMPPHAGMPPLPKVVYKWWQLPTAVTINGVACPSCLTEGRKRAVTLEFVQLLAAGPSVKVHISFGTAAASTAAACADVKSPSTKGQPAA